MDFAIHYVNDAYTALCAVITKMFKKEKISIN